MRKKITVAQVAEKVNLIKRAGIWPHAFFMLGYPEETEADFQATLDLALRLPLVGAHFSAYRPLPGTQSHADLLQRGEISANDPATAAGTLAAAVYAPRGLTCPRVKAWQRRMLLKFYLRPRILLFYMQEFLRHPFFIFNLSRRALRYLSAG
jgi:radical SAM superfamily enzyme YgiQ (UPF0313 family)